MNPHLSIGTTTDRINLLDENGILLKDWVPVEGGHDSNYVESSLGDYGQVISYRETDVEEKFVLTIKRSNQDDVIRMGQNLRRMLRTALNYWTDSWREDFVYIAARAAGETNTRYAIVKDGSIPKDNNPFAIPFAQCAPVMNDFELFITRGPWLADVPGTATAIELSAIQTYDGRNLGNVDSSGVREPTTTEGEVFFASKWNTANITDIWYWDNSATAWCAANLMDHDLTVSPFAFLPPTPLQTDDFVLFGIDTSIDDSGPFCSLVFDIGTAIGVGGGITIEWRMRRAGDTDDPSTWTAITVQDNTNQDGLQTGDAFDTTGVHSVHWKQPDDWDEADPQVAANPALGIDGYWVAAYVTAGDVASTPPTQQNRDIYTITWPYIEVDGDLVEGDLLSQVKLRLREQTDLDGVTRIIGGLRSVERGASFRSYLNYAAEQNGPHVTANDPGIGVFGDHSDVPSGEYLSAVPVGAWTLIANFAIDSDAAPDYRGTFHVFLRVISDVAVQVKVQSRFINKADIIYDSGTLTVPSASSHCVVDVGRVQFIPPDVFEPDEVFGLNIKTLVNGVGTIHLIDMILIPVDEWAFEIRSTGVDEIWGGNRDEAWGGDCVILDGIEYPRRSLRAVETRNSTGEVSTSALVSANSSTGFPPRKDSRIHLFAIDDVLDIAIHELAGTAQAWSMEQYLSMRGDR